MLLLRRAASFTSEHEFWLLWVYGAPLLFAKNLPLYFFAAALATIPLFWLARRVTYGHWSLATPLDLPLGLVVLMGLVGVAISTDRSLSLRVYGEALGGVALFYGIVNGLPFVRFARGVWFFLGLAGVMGLVGWLGMFYTEKFLPVAFIYDYLPHLDFFFLNSSGFTANLVAGAIAPVLPVALAWAWTQSRWQRAFALLLTLFFVSIVILTQSRGAFLGIMVSSLILFLWRVPRMIWVVVIGCIVMAGAVFWFGPFNIANILLVSDSTNTAASRFEVWTRALDILQDFPFTGIGLGTFPHVLPLLYPLFLNDSSLPIPHVHNIFLQMGVDYGLPGFVAFIGLVTTMLCVGVTTIVRARGARATRLAAGLLAGYGVYLVHGLLDAVTTNSKVSIIIWFMMGLMMVQSRAAQKGRDLVF